MIERQTAEGKQQQALIEKLQQELADEKKSSAERIRELETRNALLEQQHQEYQQQHWNEAEGTTPQAAGDINNNINGAHSPSFLSVPLPTESINIPSLSALTGATGPSPSSTGVEADGTVHSATGPPLNSTSSSASTSASSSSSSSLSPPPPALRKASSAAPYSTAAGVSGGTALGPGSPRQAAAEAAVAALQSRYDHLAETLHLTQEQLRIAERALEEKSERMKSMETANSIMRKNFNELHKQLELAQKTCGPHSDVRRRENVAGLVVGWLSVYLFVCVCCCCCDLRFRGGTVSDLFIVTSVCNFVDGFCARVNLLPRNRIIFSCVSSLAQTSKHMCNPSLPPSLAAALLCSATAFGSSSTRSAGAGSRA